MSMVHVPVGTTMFSTVVTKKQDPRVNAVSQTGVRMLVSLATSIGNVNTKAALQVLRKRLASSLGGQ